MAYGFVVLAGDPVVETRAALSRLGGEDHAATDPAGVHVRALLLLTVDLLELPIWMRYHWLAVKYEQSIQPWGPWLVDWAKGEAIGLRGRRLPGLAAVLRDPTESAALVVLGLAGVDSALVFGVFVDRLMVDPLFYRFTPLADTRPAWRRRSRR